jgi:hypothetical protein
VFADEFDFTLDLILDGLRGSCPRHEFAPENGVA